MLGGGQPANDPSTLLVLLLWDPLSYCAPGASCPFWPLKAGGNKMTNILQNSLLPTTTRPSTARTQEVHVWPLPGCGGCQRYIRHSM